jgi:hypothetical protein
MAATQATKEAIWWRTLLNELSIPNIISNPSTIYSDSQGSIALVKNPAYHSRTKHIDIQHHYVREQAAAGTVAFQFIGTDGMVADILTKPLTKTKHQQLVKLMGITF